MKVVVSKIAQRTFKVESCIHGFHINGTGWKPCMGEILSCSRKGNNREDLLTSLKLSRIKLNGQSFAKEDLVCLLDLPETGWHNCVHSYCQ